MRLTISCLTKLLVVVLLMLLAGCHEGIEYEHSHQAYPIVQFGMVDTDGTNSGFNSVYDLNISPYINGGQFELYWETLPYRNYSVELRVNTWPSLVGSQLIYSDFCGSGYFCDETPILYCDYQMDFDIACEGFFGNPQIANIGHLLTNIPQQVYFILDVCDEYNGYCDFQALPVLME